MEHERIVVLDFGGQYSHLIARRVRECGVYCEVMAHTVSLSKLKGETLKGIILTGGPNSVYAPGSPVCDAGIFSIGVPILGICYGAQLVAFLNGGQVVKAPTSEFGGVELRPAVSDSLLFDGVPASSVCWMSHTDFIALPPDGFRVTAVTNDCGCAAMEDGARRLYAVQFHPEVSHSAYGQAILQNFLKKICGCRGDWQMAGYVEATIQDLRREIGDKKVLCALSGGVDSTVAAAMVHRAVGDQLTCMFVDHGLLRKNEGDQVERICRDQLHMNFVRINARERFYQKLSGVSEPERKRKIIGEEFIRVFEEEGRKLGKMDYLVQGTIYPDVIESGAGDSAVIKSHHNVGGLPDAIDFKGILEPLRLLFKDEVRKAGLELGVSPELVYRQPFPGPGLAVRIIGEITPEKVLLLQDADFIFREEIERAKLSVNQYFAVLTDMRSVGVMGDGRTYDYTVALRGVTTNDFMTADFARIPYEVLDTVSRRIVNEVKCVNRVVYDITSKPPATIEWE